MAEEYEGREEVHEERESGEQEYEGREEERERGEEEVEVEVTPEPIEEEPTPETPEAPTPPFAEPVFEGQPAAEQPGPRTWLSGISTETWLVASLLGLLAIILLGALVVSLSIRNTRRTVRDVAMSSNIQIQELQNRVDSLTRELEALRQANAELQRSLEGRLASQVETLQQADAELQRALETSIADQLEALRQDLETADQELRDEVVAALEEQNQALRQEVEAGLAETSQRMQELAARVRLEMLLMRASREALQARMHLAEKSAGLAKRNLRDVEATLSAAIQATDNEELRATLEKLRQSIRELREGIEAETFPVTTVEVLIDQIDGVIRGLSAGE